MQNLFFSKSFFSLFESGFKVSVLFHTASSSVPLRAWVMKEGSTVVSGISFQAAGAHSKDVTAHAQAMTTTSQLLLGQQ